MVGICSDGTEFIFDIEDFEKVKEWNWMHHHDAIEGNKGRLRRSLAKVVLNIEDKTLPVLRINKVFDYRRSNLYSSNTYIDKGIYYEVITIKNEIFYIDKDDYDKVRKFRWYINYQGYPEAICNKERIRLNRYLLGLDEKFTYERVVDHIDKNPLNNRKYNLRIVDQGINARNRSMMSNNTSGVTGAFWSKELKAWRTSRTICGKKYDIGIFNNLDEAKRELERFDYYMANNIEFIPCSTYKKRISSSGYKYVYNHNPNGYTVVVKNNGKDCYLGLYHDLEQAIKVRDNYLKLCS